MKIVNLTPHPLVIARSMDPGYPEDGSSIMLMCLYDGRATNDPYFWVIIYVSTIISCFHRLAP